jgi:hypothetical protein
MCLFCATVTRERLLNHVVFLLIPHFEDCSQLGVYTVKRTVSFNIFGELHGNKKNSCLLVSLE